MSKEARAKEKKWMQAFNALSLSRKTRDSEESEARVLARTREEKNDRIRRPTFLPSLSDQLTMRSARAPPSRGTIPAAATKTGSRKAVKASKAHADVAIEKRQTPPTTTKTKKSNQLLDRRSTLLAAGGLALSGALGAIAGPARAAAEMAPSSAASTLIAAATSAVPASSSPSYPTVYFGNGCFWGRQHDFVEAETKELGRKPEQLTSVTGYAGGARGAAPDGRVCYYYANDASVYERRGHAEVVRVGLAPPGRSDASPEEQEKAMRAFARVYFSQFVPRKSRDGKVFALRQDPQDAGPGYRNVVGLPGGIRGPLFEILEEEKSKSALASAIALVEGRGNDFRDGKPSEDDEVGKVFVYDSVALPFFAAERWHQFHNGLGKSFDKTYRKGYKQAAEEAGAFGPTGCPEFPFL